MFSIFFCLNGSNTHGMEQSIGNVGQKGIG